MIKLQEAVTAISLALTVAALNNPASVTAAESLQRQHQVPNGTRRVLQILEVKDSFGFDAALEVVDHARLLDPCLSRRVSSAATA